MNQRNLVWFWSDQFLYSFENIKVKKLALSFLQTVNTAKLFLSKNVNYGQNVHVEYVTFNDINRQIGWGDNCQFIELYRSLQNKNVWYDSNPQQTIWLCSNEWTTNAPPFNHSCSLFPKFEPRKLSLSSFSDSPYLQKRFFKWNDGSLVRLSIGTDFCWFIITFKWLYIQYCY